MNYELHNNYLTATISSMGAELKSVKDNSSGFEFMWQANPTIWARTSPVLFPIVGKLNQNKLHIGSETYAITQHGFARDMEFVCISNTFHKVEFLLASNEETRKYYPYEFEFMITYELHEQTISCTWQINNKGKSDLYVSVGAHPGFNLKGAKMDDYELQFSPNEKSQRYLLTDGLLNGQQERLSIENNILHLDIGLFDKDAIVLKSPTSNTLSLKHKHSLHEVVVTYPGFPYLGIWSKKGCSEFLCIEPWFGIADTLDHLTDISLKEGIQVIKAGDICLKSYQMSFHD